MHNVLKLFRTGSAGAMAIVAFGGADLAPTVTEPATARGVAAWSATSDLILLEFTTHIGFPPAAPLSALAPESVGDDPCQGCESCVTPEGWPGHTITNVIPIVGVRYNPHSSCVVVECEVCYNTGAACHGHSPCMGTGVALKAFEEAKLLVQRGAEGKLRDAYLSSGGALVLNRKRGALQAVGCDSVIVAQIPLSSAQLRLLDQAAED